MVFGWESSSLFENPKSEILGSGSFSLGTDWRRMFSSLMSLWREGYSLISVLV